MQQQRCLSMPNGGSGGGACSGGVNNNTNCFYAATAPVVPITNIPPTTTNTTAALGGLSMATTISPTFIEHKYSANTFKEKFFANLRQNHQQNSNSKLKTLKTTFNNDTNNLKSTLIDKNGSINNNNNDSNNEMSMTAISTSSSSLSECLSKNSLECEDIVTTTNINETTDGNDDNVNNGVAGEVVVANHRHPDLCSIQQQLTENVKNNFYKKTIN